MLATKGETMATFGNATITIQHSGGHTDKIRVLGEVSTDGELLDGALYTEAEWKSETHADWEYDRNDGLLFQGQPGGPYNFATYEIATDRVSEALKATGH